jgi:hypothetical protein
MPVNIAIGVYDDAAQLFSLMLTNGITPRKYCDYGGGDGEAGLTGHSADPRLRFIKPDAFSRIERRLERLKENYARPGIGEHSRLSKATHRKYENRRAAVGIPPIIRSILRLFTMIQRYTITSLVNNSILQMLLNIL